MYTFVDFSFSRDLHPWAVLPCKGDDMGMGERGGMSPWKRGGVCIPSMTRVCRKNCQYYGVVHLLMDWSLPCLLHLLQEKTIQSFLHSNEMYRILVWQIIQAVLPFSSVLVLLLCQICLCLYARNYHVPDFHFPPVKSIHFPLFIQSSSSHPANGVWVGRVWWSGQCEEALNHQKNIAQSRLPRNNIINPTQ